MSKEGGHPLLPEIEPLFKEGATPFHQTIINIREAFDWLKKEKIYQVELTISQMH